MSSTTNFNVAVGGQGHNAHVAPRQSDDVIVFDISGKCSDTGLPEWNCNDITIEQAETLMDALQLSVAEAKANRKAKAEREESDRHAILLGKVHNILHEQFCGNKDLVPSGDLFGSHDIIADLIVKQLEASLYE